jgi:hypothetical protein
MSETLGHLPRARAVSRLRAAGRVRHHSGPRPRSYERQIANQTAMQVLRGYIRHGSLFTDNAATTLGL